MKKSSGIIGFVKRHPILFNFVLIVVTACILVWVALICIDNWTEHGKYKEVPDVKGLSYDAAVEKIALAGLGCELSDSLYDSSSKPGTVLEQSPKKNSKVKSNRTIYLTVNAFAPKLITLPKLTDVSLRQAEAVLMGLGIKNVKVEYVSSEYKDLVLKAKFNGVELRYGSRIPVSATVILEVGEGSGIDADTDSLAEEAESDSAFDFF